MMVRACNRWSGQRTRRGVCPTTKVCMPSDAVSDPRISESDGVVLNQVVVKGNCYYTQIGATTDIQYVGDEMDCCPLRPVLAGPELLDDVRHGGRQQLEQPLRGRGG